jgi:hypothetical protein
VTAVTVPHTCAWVAGPMHAEDAAIVTLCRCACGSTTRSVESLTGPGIHLACAPLTFTDNFNPGGW